MIRIFSHRFNIRIAFFFVTEGFLILSSVGLAIALRFIFDKHQTTLDPTLLSKALIFAAVCQLCFSYSDLYSFKHNLYNERLVRRILQSLLAAALLILIISFFFPSLPIGHGIFTISLIILPVLVISWRRIYSQLLDKRLLNARVLIVGAGNLALEIGKEILSNQTYGYRIVGFIDKDSSRVGQKILNPSIIGQYSQILGITVNEKVDRIIVALPERRGNLPVGELLKCKMLGVEVEDGLSFYEKMTGKVSLEELKPSWLIYSDGFRIQKHQRIIKRAVDILLSIMGLLFTIPFFVLVPVLIRLDSRGRVFYRQGRVGENGKRFTLLKFRSMCPNAEAGLGPIWAKKNDSRITRIGKFLRKARIDEIPQLINVLKGEMSFVGPRPERPAFVDQFNADIPYYQLRYSVKPGITGWAQVKFQYGASKEDTCEKLQYDLYYIKNLSAFLDFNIILSTIKVVLLARGSR